MIESFTQQTFFWLARMEKKSRWLLLSCTEFDSWPVHFARYSRNSESIHSMPWTVKLWKRQIILRCLHIKPYAHIHCVCMCLCVRYTQYGSTNRNLVSREEKIAAEMFSFTFKTFPNVNKLSKIHSLNGIVAIRNCSVIDKTPIDEENGIYSIIIHSTVWMRLCVETKF